MQTQSFVQSPSAIQTRLAPANAETLALASDILAKGGAVAFPTETVYGLGADATNPAAVARIFAAKGRPHFNPLISHVPNQEAAFALGIFNSAAKRLAEAFWPGPLTLVVPISPVCSVCELARAGLASIAIRVPAHPVAETLLKAFGKPIVAPSANRSGHVSPSLASHVMGDLAGRIDLVIDAGATGLGLESTILACLSETPTLLRPGSITREMAAAIVGQLDEVLSQSEAAPLAPGQLASHYAPRAHLRLNAVDIRPGEAALLFGPAHMPGQDQAVQSANLSFAGNLLEAAANLYAMLRLMDASGAQGIAVAPIPVEGLGEAILDRLRRAAAPR